ncbi:hypothetical protein HanRHA438_Chr09g0418871 [Helianthus annuus]|nr:hypothetical protein HanRHA438_Chr09g0418871 [Helianthus annuus]
MRNPWWQHCQKVQRERRGEGGGLYYRRKTHIFGLPEVIVTKIKWGVMMMIFRDKSDYSEGLDEVEVVVMMVVQVWWWV